MSTDVTVIAQATFTALLVGYLPGAILYRIPAGNRRHRAGLTAEERVFWAVVLSAGWSMVVVLALAGLGRYSFGRLLAVNLAVVAVTALAFRGHLRYDAGAPRISATALIPAAIIGLGLWLYFPPSEYVMGGKDPGAYINEGIQIAQRGQLIIRDPVVAAVPSEARDLFFPPHKDQQRWYYGLRFMGFFIQDPDDGRVVGQFPHLFPASIAIGYGLNGLSGARQAVGAWAMLGLVAVYFAGARIFGRTAAAAAAGLLAINVAEIWFARIPNSEVVMQALLFAAILAFARALDGSRGFFGFVAGALLGLMLFLRYEVVLAFAAFGAAATLAPVMKRRVGFTFPVTLAAVGLAGLWYLAGPLRAYGAYPLAVTRENGGWWLVAVGVLGVGIARLCLRSDRFAAVVRVGVPATLATSLAVLAIYAYFFRQEGGRTALGDAMAFRAFGWYLTPWVLGASMAGMVVLTWRRFWRDPAFLLTFAAFGIFFFYKTRIVPEHFWSSRRFLSMALPGALLFLAALADELLGDRRLAGIARRFRGDRPETPETSEKPLWASIAGVVLVSAALSPVAATFWNASTPVRHHVEYAGLISRLEQLAARIGDRDLVIVESRNAGSDLHVLALPLAYIYARNVLVLDSPVPSKRPLEDFVAWARSQYSGVLFLGGGGTDLLTRHLAAEPIAGDRFQVAEYASPTNAYPAGVRQKEFEFGLYRLIPAADLPAGPINLSIGVLDDLNVVRFHAKELRPDTGTMFRWTRATSYVLLLGMSRDARRLTVSMSNGGRPPNAPPAVVEVALADRVLGTATPADVIRPYVFDIPADVAAFAAESPDPVRLTLRTATWNPRALLGLNDTRDLGVLVTRVEVR